MAVPLGLILLIGLILGLWQRRDDYFLNKCVRLVTTRMIQFERLSRIRREEYKFEFNQDHYLILHLSPNKQAWETFTRHKYPGGLSATLQNFEIHFAQGEISSIRHQDQEVKLGQYLVLSFFHPKHQDKKKGIIFHADRSWRPLT